MVFSQMLAIRSWSNKLQYSLDKNKPYKCQKNKKFVLNSGIQTNQILTNDDEVCIPCLSSILLAVRFWVKNWGSQCMADPHFPPTQTNYLKIRTQHHEIHISYLFTDKVCEKQNLQNLNPTIHNTLLDYKVGPCRKCVSTGAVGAQTCRFLEHHLLHPWILRL